MSRTLEEVREEALQLAPGERAALADDLWWSCLTDEEREIQKEWIDVAESRAEELRSGAVKGIPLDDVMREVRAKCSRERRSSSRG
jgi:putative addiction module component (TIGR02574 family)